MRFLLDMGITPQAVPLFRSFGHEAHRCNEFCLGSAFDEEIVDFPRANDFVVVTTDKRFGDILMLSDTREPGVIIPRLDNPSFAQMLSALRLVLETYCESDIQRAIIVVEHGKIRRHPLD